MKIKDETLFILIVTMIFIVSLIFLCGFSIGAIGGKHYVSQISGDYRYIIKSEGWVSSLYLGDNYVWRQEPIFLKRFKTKEEAEQWWADYNKKPQPIPEPTIENVKRLD